MEIKKVTIICVFTIMIIAFYSLHKDIAPPLYIKVNGIDVAEDAAKNSPSFLSDKYFYELDLLFEQIKKANGEFDFFNGSKSKAANIVIDKMMNDLENNPDIKKHRNFSRFFGTFNRYIQKVDIITERMHFFRNKLNSYSGAPVTLKEMVDLAAKGKWRLFSAKFHRFYYGNINGSLNVKFISRDGIFEVVYNTRTGKLVNDLANMGTYNYAPGSINPIKYYFHDKFDKKPWKKWGNVKGFPYQKIMSLKSGHETVEAENNEKEVERMIKQRKFVRRLNYEK